MHEFLGCTLQVDARRGHDTDTTNQDCWSLSLFLDAVDNTNNVDDVVWGDISVFVVVPK